MARGSVTGACAHREDRWRRSGVGRASGASRATLGLLLVFVATLPAGCGASSKSPGEVVEEALTAANDGDYEEVESYYSDAFADQMDEGLGLVFGGTDGFADYYTRGGDLEDVEITSEEINDERATVGATLTYTGPLAEGAYFAYGDEAIEESTWQLAREADGWKLIPNWMPTD